jgi:hypothetical protein
MFYTEDSASATLRFDGGRQHEKFFLQIGIFHDGPIHSLFGPSSMSSVSKMVPIVPFRRKYVLSHMVKRVFWHISDFFLGQYLISPKRHMRGSISWASLVARDLLRRYETFA